MLELRQVSRVFGSFAALSEVDFRVGPGEIVGLLGENGAGKSTLMNIVGGLLAPTSGTVQWDGAPVHFRSPREATARGIGVVHQHFMLVPVMTIAENVALHAAHEGALYDGAAMAGRVEAWAHSLGWRLDARRRVEELGVGERQRVEIIKALFARGDADKNSSAARLLLLDEPTANLTPPEAEELFAVLRRLKAQGCGIVFVSHKLHEVLALCDRIVTLRHGRVVGERKASETSVGELAALMVGHALHDAPPSQRALDPNAPVRLDIKGLSSGMLRDFSLRVRQGEIVGLAGVDGNGQRELVEALSGLGRIESGRFDLPGDAESIALIPPDRQVTGLIADFDLTENMALHPALRAACRKRLGFDWNEARRQTRALMERFDVRAPARGDKTLAGSLSGGNGQKLVIARALSFPHGVVVASDPTRGLDIGATRFVHEQLRRAAQESGVLLLSTDLDEILSLSDRIGVLYEGRLLPGPELLPSSVDRGVVGALMGGVE